MNSIKKMRSQTQKRIRLRARWQRCGVGPSRNTAKRVMTRALRTMKGMWLMTAVAIATEFSSLVNYRNGCPSAQETKRYFLQYVMTFIRQPWPVERAFVGTL